MYKRIVAFTATAALLTACGGGGASQSTPPVTGPQKGGNVTVGFTIAVPGNSVQTARGRRPLYISRDTRGIGIDYEAASSPAFNTAPNATPNAAAALVAGSGGCNAAAANGSYSCTVYISGVPTGYDNFRFTLWNAAPHCATAPCPPNAFDFSQAGDEPLSVTALNDYAIENNLNNVIQTVGLTLDPVVSSARVTLNNGITDGASSAMTANVTLLDDNGNVILSPGPGTDPLIDQNGNALTVTLNVANDLGAGCPAAGAGNNQSKSNGCSLYFGTSGSPLAANPSFGNDGTSTITTTITYDGAKQFPSNANGYGTVTLGGKATVGDTVTATINGRAVVYSVTAGDVAAASPLASIAANLAAAINADATDKLVVSAVANGYVVAISADITGAGGAYSLTTATSGGATETAAASGANLVVNSQPQVTVSYNAGASLSGSPTSRSATVAVTQSNSGGVVVPANPQYTVSSGAMTNAPSFLTLGSDGNVYAVEGTGIDFFTPCASPGPCALTNVTTVTGTPGGIASGPDGDIWYTDSASNTIVKQSTGASGVAVSSAAIGGAALGAVAAGPDGNMWFVDFNNKALDEIGVNAGAGAAPSVVDATGSAIYQNAIVSGTFSNGTQAVCAVGSSLNGPDNYLYCHDITTNSNSTPALTTATQFSGAIATGATAFGADGLLYVALNNGAIESLDGTFALVHSYALSSNATSLVAGPSDSIWFIEANGKFGRIALEGGTNVGALSEWSGGKPGVQFPASFAAPGEPGEMLSDGSHLWISDTGATNKTVDEVSP